MRSLRMGTFGIGCLALALSLPGQNVDTVITEDTRSFRIIDQIENREERRAFADLFAADSADERIKRGRAFLEKFPRSWFLAQVHDLVAKAHVDLGNFKKARGHSRRSLRFLPENPVLWVIYSDLLLAEEAYEESARAAQEALFYLDHMGRPMSLSGEEWPETRRELRASARLSLGRGALSRSLSKRGTRDSSELVSEALRHLQEARRLDPEEAQPAYLLGLAHLLLGNREQAIEQLVQAMVGGGLVADQAQQQLRRLYRREDGTSDFQEFLKGIQLSHDVSPPAIEEAENPAGRELLKAEYVGTDTCATCHPGVSDWWHETGMAKMLRPYRFEDVIGDFEEKPYFYAGDRVDFDLYGNLQIEEGKDRFLYARMGIDTGRHYVEIRPGGGEWKRYSIDYLIGSKWQQAYATVLDNGQLHVFPFQYNAIHGLWLNFWKVIDNPGSPRARVDRWDRFSSDTSYHVNCAICHTSQLRNKEGQGLDPDHLEFREPGINCEMCHGPGSRHVSAIVDGDEYWKKPLDPPVSFGKVSGPDFVAVCAQCHMQSAIRHVGEDGELNYSREVPDFFRRYKRRPLEEFSRKAFYKDGRLAETTFIVEALMRTRCYREGEAHCGLCHNPHGKDFEENQKSLKYRDDPDEMCLQCHEIFRDQEVHQNHAEHPLSSEGSRCVNCHMPKIMKSVLITARSHRIDSIPDVEMTTLFGQKGSPNACLLCHSDQNVTWLQEKLEPVTSRWP